MTYSILHRLTDLKCVFRAVWCYQRSAVIPESIWQKVHILLQLDHFLSLHLIKTSWIILHRNSFKILDMLPCFRYLKYWESQEFLNYHVHTEFVSVNPKSWEFNRLAFIPVLCPCGVMHNLRLSVAVSIAWKLVFLQKYFQSVKRCCQAFILMLL